MTLNFKEKKNKIKEKGDVLNRRYYLLEPERKVNQLYFELRRLYDKKRVSKIILGISAK